MREQETEAQTARVSVITLGCAKNEVDSEEMLGMLAQSGYIVEHAHSPEDAASGTDVLIVNTCAFIESAREESINSILEALQKKKRGEVKKVIVTGCLAQRYPKELAESLPEVDGFLGTGQMDRASEAVRSSLIRTEQIVEIAEKPHHRWAKMPTRVRLGSPWSAYLKISEGCDHACTFCAIPSFRGKHTSKPLDAILIEAQNLAAEGVRELNLIAQDSTQYGYDLYGEMRLPQLLHSLSEIKELHWIRLFYCYPSRVNRGVIEALAGIEKVCSYIDMPLQHSEDSMLRRMRRPMSRAGYLKLLNEMRDAIPDAAIRTTFIVGFPGETDQQFADLEAFIEEARFDRVGVFPYSSEEGTPAADMRPSVPLRIRQKRRDALLLRQQKISLARNSSWIGRSMEILIERRSQLDPASAIGRSFRDAPEVDGEVIVRNCTALPGTFVNTRVVEARPYDLTAEWVNTRTAH